MIQWAGRIQAYVRMRFLAFERWKSATVCNRGTERPGVTLNNKFRLVAVPPGPGNDEGHPKVAFASPGQTGKFGAGEAIRTPDPNLGKVMLYP